MLDEVVIKEKVFQAILDAAAGHPVNVSSNPQVTKLLYDELKLPPRHRRVKGRPTASRSGDAATLDELAAKYPGLPALRAILHVREQRVLRERYLATPLGKDGRIRCSFDITGTRTYRLSSRASLDGTGTNLQNQPVPIRECYVADSGQVLVSCDYSQAEAVVVAYESEDETLQALFADPTRDIHRETAAGLFGCSLDEVDDVKRFLGKKAGHAANYGMMPPKLVQIVEADYETTGVRITLAQAIELLNNLYVLRPKLKEVYWAQVRRELAHSHTLTNAWGFKRTFFGRWGDDLVRDAYSWKPQSTVGVLGCMAWVAVARAVNPLGAKVLLNVHDSLVVQCSIERVGEVAARTVDAMTIPITIKGKTFTLRVDTDVGYNWGKRKKDKKTGVIKNPNGLRDIKEFLANPERV
jgi:DNA polymerase-1